MIYPKNRKQMIWFLFIAFIVVDANINVNATECGVLQLQKNRSLGVTINTNKCKDSSLIAIGTVFDLLAKGRLWLKSTSAVEGVPEFQMICQNRTEHKVQLEFSDLLSPWLNQSKLSACSGWIDNKLSCAGENGKKEGIQCVLSYFKSYSGYNSQKIQRSTSVKMRDIKNLLQPKPSLEQIKRITIIKTIRPELKLCKKLNGITQHSNIAWAIDQNDDHIEIDIISSEGINYFGLFDCIQTVISTFPYPTFSEKVNLSINF